VDLLFFDGDLWSSSKYFGACYGLFMSDGLRFRIFCWSSFKRNCGEIFLQKHSVLFARKQEKLSSNRSSP
jgi:hypothetical protein